MDEEQLQITFTPEIFALSEYLRKKYKFSENDNKRMGSILGMCMEQGMHLVNRMIAYGVTGNKKIMEDWKKANLKK